MDTKLVKNIVSMDTLQTLINQYAPAMDTSTIFTARFLLGRNADNNWDIYKASNQTDTIFHLDKFPSPYVIINVSIENLTSQQIMVAALLCKLKSKYKSLNNIGVLYTPVSNTLLGSKPGSFIINSNHKKCVINV
ncbi:hypothetical protein QJ857_gp1059 [Tupanvirus soda lake]|uniref:NFACT RNA-binding domain-containing protein n=2 Tax=Tupanvirus TaxID=2094720 RepID=A0A6N1NJR8_9VIRU|nr:hypothetical protein QJ857_gp1059 [Tupanvirus soda lake]QKU34995.1 hypothetical protein [Tupanvirus soda lake]